MIIPAFTIAAIAAAIAVGTLGRVNVGLVSIAFAFVIGHFMVGLPAGEIVSGWPLNLFFILLGMTLLFGIARVNGTLAVLAQRVVGATLGDTRLIPPVFFLFAGVLAAFGAGNIVVCAVVLPIAMTVAVDHRISPLLMATMVIAGSNAGGLSPLAPTGIIANTLSAEQGFDIATSIFVKQIVGQSILACILYFVLKGHRLKGRAEHRHQQAAPRHPPRPEEEAEAAAAPRAGATPPAAPRAEAAPGPEAEPRPRAAPGPEAEPRPKAEPRPRAAPGPEAEPRPKAAPAAALRLKAQPRPTEPAPPAPLRPGDMPRPTAPMPPASLGLDRAQKTTLAVLVLVVGCIVLGGWDIGLTAFAGAVVLLFLRAAGEREAVRAVPWGTILLVCGVTVLVSVAENAGGIELLAQQLARLMDEGTAAPVMALTGGTLSLVSSASGVVLPTLIPTVPGLVAETGGDATRIISAIVMGAHMVTNSPISTLGALAVASAGFGVDRTRLFNQLFLVGLAGLVYAAVIVYFGIV